jgi:hypothetical protein
VCNSHSQTENARSGVTVVVARIIYMTAVAAGQSQRLYSGVGIFYWCCLSSPPQIPRMSPDGPSAVAGADMHTEVFFVHFDLGDTGTMAITLL